MTAAKHGFSQRQLETLYKKWYRMKRSGEYIEFTNFDDFVQWCAEEGFEYGKTLRRHADRGPYTKDNLFWVVTSNVNDVELESKTAAEKWDAFVDPIRKKYRKQIDDIRMNKPRGRELWRYEHPDLVREGIVFVGDKEDA